MLFTAPLIGSRCRPCLRVRAESSDSPPPRAATLRVTLRKPLGLVLSERKPTGEIFVEEVVPGGNGDQQGQIKPGDVLVACSATVLKAGKESSKEGYGDRPFDNWERVMFDCRGQDFDTVMNAIASNNTQWGIKDVTLELARRAGAAAGGGGGAAEQQQQQQGGS